MPHSVGWNTAPTPPQADLAAASTPANPGAASRTGPLCGLILTLLWAPMAVATPRLPDLGSADTVAAFWRENMGLMQVVIVSASVGFGFLIGFLGALSARLVHFQAGWSATFTILASAVTFFTALNVALGLDAAAGLVLDSAGPEAAYLLHTAGFVLAAPAAFAAVAFFVCLTAVIGRTHAFPRWLGWLAAVGAVANVGAVGGATAVTGPLNSGNGVVAGIAAPLGLFVLWCAAASTWWLYDLHRTRSDRLDTAPQP